jgi:hypothetical protein
MFESSFVAAAPAARRFFSLSTAAALQFIAVCTAVLLPLWFIPPLPPVVLREPAPPPPKGIDLVEVPPELRSAPVAAAGAGTAAGRATPGTAFGTPSEVEFDPEVNEPMTRGPA